MKVAVVQMNSGEDKAQNLATTERLLIEAAAHGAELAVLPELFTYLGRRGKHREVADAIPGTTSELLTRLARQHHLDIVGGSFLETAPGHERLFTRASRSTPTDRSSRAIGSSTCSTWTSTGGATASPTRCRPERTSC